MQWQQKMNYRFADKNTVSGRIVPTLFPRYWLSRTILIVMMGVMTFTASANNYHELVFLSWSNYIDPELVKEFEQQHNVSVRMVYFETDDTRDDMLLSSQGQGYDLVLVSGESVSRYKKRGWLAEAGPKQISNLHHIEPKWLTAFEQAEGYAVPYFWGSLGRVYRKDLVAKEVHSWKDLFLPHESLKNKILMIKTTSDVLGMAFKSLGFSANSTSKEEHERVRKLLQNQAPYVKAYSYLVLGENSALIKGDIVMAMAYNGDAIALKEAHPEIEFVLPVEGGGLWVDYLTVMSASNNKALAYKFIEFLNQPENAARLAEFVYFPTPNKEAEKILSQEFLSDPAIYPGESELAKSEFAKKLPARITKLRNHIFSSIVK